MPDDTAFALAVLLCAVAGVAVIVASRLSERARIPLPALVLAATAAFGAAIPGTHQPSHATVTGIVDVALVCVLFAGGMQIGRTRLRSAAGPVVSIGLVGTFATAAVGTGVVHLLFDIPWYGAALVGTAVAPTDPTVVFSVLGRRQIAGRTGTILEGEAGANDPVGIALVASLVAAGTLTASEAGGIAGAFALQMAVGAVVGVAGGAALVAFVKRVPLPSEGLYPLRTLASALALFGLATVLHGSGFLAVFVAGIVLADERAPYKREIERFHEALASLGEIVAFVVLGLTVDLGVLSRVDVWGPGLLLGVVLAVVIRPLVVGACLAPARLSRNERAFVLFAGLKGAVPILLGLSVFDAHLRDAPRLYGIVVVVVVFSVVVQGGLVGSALRLLRLPVDVVDPEPWALGVRLRDEPGNVHRLTVAPGSAADGSPVAQLTSLPTDAWVTLLVRSGRLVPVRGDTRLEAGDTVTVLAAAEEAVALRSVFGLPAGDPHPDDPTAGAPPGGGPGDP